MIEAHTPIGRIYNTDGCVVFDMPPDDTGYYRPLFMLLLPDAIKVHEMLGKILDDERTNSSEGQSASTLDENPGSAEQEPSGSGESDSSSISG